MNPKDWSPKCPNCNGYTTYIHDLKCSICDNMTVVWCPKCQEHITISEMKKEQERYI